MALLDIPPEVAASAHAYTPPDPWAHFFPPWKLLVRNDEYGGHLVSEGDGFCIIRHQVIKPWLRKGFYRKAFAEQIIFAQGHGEITLVNLSVNECKLLGQPKTVELRHSANGVVLVPPLTAYQLYAGAGAVIIQTAQASLKELEADSFSFVFPDEAAAA